MRLARFAPSPASPETARPLLAESPEDGVAEGLHERVLEQPFGGMAVSDLLRYEDEIRSVEGPPDFPSATGHLTGWPSHGRGGPEGTAPCSANEPPSLLAAASI